MVGPVGYIGTNVKESGLELVLAQEVVEGVVRAVRTIIKGKAPSVRLRARVQVGDEALVLGLLAAVCRPPCLLYTSPSPRDS